MNVLYIFENVVGHLFVHSESCALGRNRILFSNVQILKLQISCFILHVILI